MFYAAFYLCTHKNTHALLIILAANAWTYQVSWVKLLKYEPFFMIGNIGQAQKPNDSNEFLFLKQTLCEQDLIIIKKSFVVTCYRYFI